MFKAQPEQLVGKTCYEVVHKTDAPWPDCPHKRVMETGKPATVEFFEPTLGIHLEVSASPIFDENSEVTGSIHIAKNVTERKILESQLIQAQKMESVGRLAGGIAHDFSNLLTVVIGNAELALMSISPGDPVCEAIREISSTARGATGLIRQLLAFSRRQVIEPGNRVGAGNLLRYCKVKQRKHMDIQRTREGNDYKDLSAPCSRRAVRPFHNQEKGRTSRGKSIFS